MALSTKHCNILFNLLDRKTITIFRNFQVDPNKTYSNYTSFDLPPNNYYL